MVTFNDHHGIVSAVCSLCCTPL